MANMIKADLVAKGKKFAIVISRFNEFISSNFLPFATRSAFIMFAMLATLLF